MKKKYVFLFLTFSLAGAACFYLFYKNSSLGQIPANADKIIILDSKKCRNYIGFQYLMHPSLWKSEESKSNSISFFDLDVEMPYYVQLFHVKGTPITQWFTFFRVKDMDILKQFLIQEKFSESSDGLFTKDKITLKIAESLCLLAINRDEKSPVFENIYQKMNQSTPSIALDLSANFLLGKDSYGAYFEYEKGIQNAHQIYLTDDELHIQKEKMSAEMNKNIQDISQNKAVFSIHFNEQWMPKVNEISKEIFKSNSIDSLKVNQIYASVQSIEQENDTIQTFGYDDNFNEIIQKSVQKIWQPQYQLSIQSQNPIFLWTYFKKYKWINEKQEFVKIPFGKNTATQTPQAIEIKTQKVSKMATISDANYIQYTFSNSAWIQDIPLISKKGKRIFSQVQSVQYVNKNAENFFQIQFKSRNEPWIFLFK